MQDFLFIVLSLRAHYMQKTFLVFETEMCISLRIFR